MTAPDGPHEDLLGRAELELRQLPGVVAVALDPGPPPRAQVATSSQAVVQAILDDVARVLDGVLDSAELDVVALRDVPPLTLETELRSLPGVLAVCVEPGPRGEVGQILVQTRDGAGAGEIRDVVARRVSGRFARQRLVIDAPDARQ